MRQLFLFLKKLCLLAIVPACVGGVSFFLFDFIQSSYTAEAHMRLQVEKGEDDGLLESSRVNLEMQSQGKLVNLIQSMRSERPLRMLAFSLAAHDLTAQEPFSMRRQAMEYLHREDQVLLATAFREKLTQFDIGFGDTPQDSLMELLLRRLGYTSSSLSDKLSISRIPGLAQIRVKGHGYTPEMSSFMVNSFCEEFIRYHITVEKERLESSIHALGQMLPRKRAELEEKTARLRGEREILRGIGADVETREILRKIDKLEASLGKEQMKVEALKARIEASKRRKPDRTVAVRWFVKTKQSHPQKDLAIQLGSAMAHISFIEEELLSLHRQLESKEEAVLSAFEEEVMQAEHAYLAVLDKLRDSEAAQAQIEQSLVIVAKGTSRFPNPLASRFLAGLAALMSLFLWTIWLFQVKYLRWTSISARNLPNS